MDNNRYNILSEDEEKLPLEQRILNRLGITHIPNYEIEKYIVENKSNLEKKSKEKKMMCMSILERVNFSGQIQESYSPQNHNSSRCSYGNKCSYAHSIFDQRLDGRREQLYKIIFDKNNDIKILNKELIR